MKLLFLSIFIFLRVCISAEPALKKYAAMPDGVVIDTIDDYDETGRTPLHHAARIGYLDAVLNILKVGANVTKLSQYDSESAILLAAEGGHDVVVSALIRAGADVNYPNKQKITPIFAASQVGFTRTVQVLLNAGATIGRISDGGLTPLMAAAMRGKTNTAKVLLDSNPAGVNMSSSLGETILMSAIVSRNLKCVEMILNASADIHATDKKKRTALMYAASRNLVHITQLLIDKGADMDKKDKYDQTALDLAYVSCYFLACSLLIYLTFNIKTCFQENQYLETCNVLLSAGASVSSRGIRMNDDVLAKREAVLQAREDARRWKDEKRDRILDFSQREAKQHFSKHKS
jgi:ankyrin repeat protein